MPSRIQSISVELDLSRYELRRGDRTVRLEKQPMELLILLVERQGQLVTREEIVAQLWGHQTFLDTERSINTAVRKIRIALRDDPDAPTFIQTVVGKGYRFIGPVRVIRPEAPAPRPASSGGQPAAEPNHEKHERHENTEEDRAAWIAAWIPRDTKNKALLAAVCVVVLGLALAVVLWQRRQRPANPQAGEIRSLAVLPLANLTGDPNQDYFVDGMTDELTTDLATVGALKVVSRTSVMHYKGTQKSVPEIARELNVDALVEGSVSISGGKVRITAQFIDARSDRHLWAQSYQRDLQDVLSLQNEIARSIAEQVRVQLTAREKNLLSVSRPVNPQAYEAYLQARYLMHNRRTMDGARRSMEYSLRAIRADKDSALGYAALAESYETLCFMGGGEPSELMPKAETAARTAIQLDDSLAVAHIALGVTRFNYFWDWAGAEREFQRATELNPSDSEGRLWTANYLIAVGHADQAVAEIRRALALDPFSMWVNRDLGRILYFAGRHDEAIAQFRQTAEMFPDSDVVQNWLAAAYSAEGDFDQSIAIDLRNRRLVAKLGKRDARETEALERAYGASGRPGYWKKTVEMLLQAPARRRQWHELAEAYVQLGQTDAAFGALDHAYQEHSFWMAWVRCNPALNPLHSDPRFGALMAKMGLAAPGRPN
jgi:TolB-like protein/DNA-binding winged helix-turn-helix (wHTH) protein/lipoprotein NlpI